MRRLATRPYRRNPVLRLEALEHGPFAEHAFVHRHTDRLALASHKMTRNALESVARGVGWLALLASWSDDRGHQIRTHPMWRDRTPYAQLFPDLRHAPKDATAAFN